MLALASNSRVVAADPTPTPTPSSTAPAGDGTAPDAQILSGSSITLPRDGSIVVQTIRSIAALSIDDLALAQPTSQPLIADAAHVATSVTIGPFTAGTNLVFSLHSSFTNQTYLSTGNNARVIAHGVDRWAIGWEDWLDFNYSDVTMLVCYAGPVPECPRPAEATFGFGAFGNGTMAQAAQSDPVNSATGNYISQSTDAHLPGRGLAFEFVRSYNSLSTDGGVLGQGWAHSFAARIVVNADGSATFVAEDGAKTIYAPDGAGGFQSPPGAYGLLSPVGGGGYELLKRDQVRYRFDPGGVLQSMTDRNNNAIVLSYTSGRLTTITDTVGRQISLGYNPDGTLASLSFPPGRTVAYGYDPSGRLESVTDVRGGITTYGYEAAGRLERITDQNGRDVVTNTYGPDGRVIEQVDARGFHSTFDWVPATETSTMTDARGGEWVDEYDAGILMARRDPLGNTTRYSFAADLSMSATTDPRGFTTETTIDSAGNLVSRKSPAPLSYTESWTYSIRNDPLTHVDRRGNTTTFTYDAAGNLKTVRGPAPVSPVTTFNYDPAGTGLLFSVVDPLAKSTTYGYDTQANRNRVTTPLANVTTMSYDAGGRMETVVEPRGNVAGADPAQYTTSFTYDAADNLLTTTDALADATTQTFDPAGNRLTVTDANNHQTTFSYDAANHLLSVTDARTEATTYAYDEVGNLVTRTDANDRVTTYAYDLAGQLTSTTDPLNHVWTTTHDASGNPLTRTDAKNKTTAYLHDALNRLTRITYADTSTPTVSFTFDANGNQVSMSDGGGTETSVFDTLNRPTSVTRGTVAFSYGYDRAGKVTSRTYPGQTAHTFVYDDDGRLTHANGATYTYDAAANPLTALTIDGFTARWSYDRAGRLLETAHTRTTGTLSRFTYALDPVGNRTAMTSRQGTVTYRYDELDRLTEACWSATSCPGGPPAAPVPCIACVGGLLSRPAATTNPPTGETFRTYTYDPVGNRLTEASDAGATNYAYDAADRLTTVTAPGNVVTTYTFDDNGNQAAAGARTFTYDFADRLKTATVGTTTETYTYAGDGVRLSASTGSQAAKTTKSLWDRSFGLPQLAIERNGSDALLRSYRYGLDLISQAAGSKTYYYHHDGLGSVADVTGSTGTPVSWTEYYPHGLVRQAGKAGGANGAPAVDPFLFTGEQLDPVTGLYHLRARQYDPSTGRFISTDPVSLPITDPYVAAYVYVGQNPVLLTDPSGRCFGPLIFLAPACIGAVAGAVIGVASYVGSTLAGNVVSNAANDRPLTEDLGRGLNPGDAIISGGVGALTGPLGGITFAPTRILATATYGCAATFASQAIGGRTSNLGETGSGCVFGAVAGIPKISAPILSGLYGFLVATAQTIANSGQGATSPSGGK